MALLVSVIFIILAAFFNAVMDKVENENFINSIFKNWNPKFWYKRISWQYATKIFGYKIDAWHLAKSCMIVCMTLAIVNYISFIPIIDFFLLGIIWNISFNFFYKHL